MMNAFKDTLKKGERSTTQKRGIISLTLKPQKYFDYLKNWRPITLLNQDYTYLAKIVHVVDRMVSKSIYSSKRLLTHRMGFYPKSTH